MNFNYPPSQYQQGYSMQKPSNLNWFPKLNNQYAVPSMIPEGYQGYANCQACQGTGYLSFSGKSYPCHYCLNSNIRSRFAPISNCSSCAGSGEVLSNRGRRRFCYECARRNGHCPNCNNTGYKVGSGKRCHCGLFGGSSNIIDMIFS